MAEAPASSVFSGSLKAGTAVKRTCEGKLAAGRRGVVVRRMQAADTGLLRARLGARRGDWDLAVFDAASKRLVAASSGFRSREVAESFVLKGQRLAVQACRRKGKARKAALTVRTIALRPPTGEKIKLARVKAPTQAERSLLASSDFDLTEHGGADYLDVLLHGEDDVARLRKSGFDFEVLIEDVVAADNRALQRGAPSKRTSPGDGTPLEDARGPVMPSGRVAYRRLFDYTTDMKALLEDADLKGYVRPVVLNHPSLEGREVQGIEIARNVHRDDGRPVYLQMGLHHAREWPSGEHAIEFGIDILENRDAEALRIGSRTVNVKELLGQVRTVVVPAINPDGFNVSREATYDAQLIAPAVLNNLIPLNMAYKRKNCRLPPEGLLTPEPRDCASAPNNAGVDPNRNYGGFWGGPGASGAPLNETYWGAGPFSEPETQNVRELVSERQVVALITNHTYSDLVLRPPGLKSQGEPFDEHGHYKPLGDAMAAENGYRSQRSYQLYDTTGTTEDWSYYATGGLGFTFEIGKGEGVAITGAGFHPAWPVGVPAEYFGKGPWAGRGNRSAYFVAMEWAADRAGHSVIEGDAKRNSTLKLTKTFDTLTSPRPENDGEPLAITDHLETTLKMDEGGRFTWHVNPSTRPNVAKGVEGREVDGRPPSEPRTWETSGAFFAPGAGADVPGTYEEREFTVPETEDNGESTLRIEYPVRPQDVEADLDLFVYKRVDGSWQQIGSSTSNNSAKEPCTLAGRAGDCRFEQAVVSDLGNGAFKFRVGNWASTTTDWVGRMTFEAPVARETIPPGTESWTLTCLDRDGDVRGTPVAVTVERGGSIDVGNVCGGSPKRSSSKGK